MRLPSRVPPVDDFDALGELLGPGGVPEFVPWFDPPVVVGCVPVDGFEPDPVELLPESEPPFVPLEVPVASGSSRLTLVEDSFSEA